MTQQQLEDLRNAAEVLEGMASNAAKLRDNPDHRKGNARRAPICGMASRLSKPCYRASQVHSETWQIRTAVHRQLIAHHSTSVEITGGPLVQQGAATHRKEPSTWREFVC